MTNVAFVTNVVPIYRYPIFEQLCRAGEFCLRILVTVPLKVSCPEAVARLPIKYSTSLNLLRTTRHASSGATQREPFAVPLALVKDLIRCRPDVIVAGDLGLRSLVCWCVARLLRARFVISSEEIPSSAMGRARLQHWLRRFLLRRADAFLAWGVPAKLYLTSMSVGQGRIFTCAQAIDNEFWFRQARALDARSEKLALGLSGTVFLLVGRALPRKGFHNFLTAWGRLPPDLHPRISAVLVGDGHYLPHLKQYAERHALRNVHFAGARSGAELARFYAAADIFVFPSLEDVWGLVVNEAMCFGLPILASRYAGASQSLLADSRVGSVFDPADIDEFAARLHSWALAPPARAPDTCREVLKDVTFMASSAAIRRMVARVTGEALDDAEP
jgi:glycosyltransferase involved in cell wall biosynthesis